MYGTMKLSMKSQVLTIRAICALVTGFGLLHFGLDWSALFMMMSGFYLFTRIGGDVGFHRYFCHRCFQTSRLAESALLILGTLSNIGSSITWVGTHLAHHAKSDKQGDPHSPSRIGIWRVITLNWDDFSFPVSSIRRLKDNPLHNFTHRYYLWIILLFMALLASLHLKVFVFFYCAAIVYSFLATGIVNSVGHLWGYRNFETNDRSQNNLFVHLISLGGGMHNNHHAHPEKYDYSAKKWYEIDPAAYIIKLLKTSHSAG